MTTKKTKTVASRIPVDLYTQLESEAKNQDLNMKDLILKILLARNQNQNQPSVVPEKQPKKKAEKNIKLDSAPSLFE